MSAYLIPVFFLVFWCSGWIFSRNFKEAFAAKNQGSLNGSRGFLGFAVFLSHSLTWKYYLTTGIWGLSSHLIQHLGTTSVGIFFMLSAFLFFPKIIDNKTNWLHLYCGRVLRLIPLWLFLVFLFLCLFFISGGGFSNKYFIRRVNDVNISIGYSIITSGVTWSLWYEWLLYFSLPLFAVAIGFRPGKLIITFSISLVAGLAFIYNYNPINFIYFFLGVLVFKLPEIMNFIPVIWHQFCKSFFLIFPGCLLYTTDPGNYFYVFLFGAFVFYALSKNYDIFNVLKSTTSNWLGERGYSLYLMQGPFIYFVIYLIGFERISVLSMNEYAVLIIFVTPIYVYFCSLTHEWIEKRFWNKNLVVRLGNGLSSKLFIK